MSSLFNIARELVAHVCKSVTIDWTLRESGEAISGTSPQPLPSAEREKLKSRILRKYGYPPDKQEKATQTVLEQTKLLCGDWAEEI